MSHMRANKTAKQRKRVDHGAAVQRICDAYDIEAPEREYRFHPERRWRFDFAWPLYQLAVEVNGGAFVQGRHTRGMGAVKDWEKLNEAQLLEWTVLQVTPKQITDGTLARLLNRAIRGVEAA